MRTFLKFFISIIIFSAVLLGVAFVVLPLPGDPTILMYHFLGTEEDARNSKNFVSTKSFEAHLKFLKRFGYKVISLEELYEIKTGRKKGSGKEVVITFDDGNYTFYTKAYDILKKYEMHTAVFVVTESMKDSLYGSMSKEQIAELDKKNWINMQSHTKTHPFLAEISPEEVQSELIGAKKSLEKLLYKKVEYIAYPYGNFNEEVKVAAENAGYKLAFTTSHKKLRGLKEDLFSITRTKITRSADHPFVLWFKVSGLYDFFKSIRYRAKTYSSS